LGWATSLPMVLLAGGRESHRHRHRATKPNANDGTSEEITGNLVTAYGADLTPRKKAARWDEDWAAFTDGTIAAPIPSALTHCHELETNQGYSRGDHGEFNKASEYRPGALPIRRQNYSSD
jgi:hypothetical protein